MAQPLKLGIAGLGTVGAHVFKLLEENAELLEQRCLRPVVVTAVSARNKDKDRGIDLKNVRWFDDPLNLASDEEVDVVVELIGGDSGTAFDLVEKGLKAGKKIVTANKALLAVHGEQFAKMEADCDSTISFEAAVAGGIPVIKGLREGLAANDIKAVYGILNGTCNYILTQMRETGEEFADVLEDAQDLGYAEADPSTDIDGIDAGHKLALLAAIAFGTKPEFQSVDITGIRDISPLDLQYADELGYKIKLLGVARSTDAGIEQSVKPCMVPVDSPIASVDGVLNAVRIEGNFVEQTLFVGHGAGGGPTASAVVADIVDLARGQTSAMLGVPYDQLQDMKVAASDQRHGAYYLRLMVKDEPGVVADVSAILRDFDVSLETVLQHSRSSDQPVPLILTTHEALEADILTAIEKISQLNAIIEPPRLLRIENLI